MTEYTFRLLGRIKPFVRMTQRGKWVDPQAQAYLASKEHLAWQMLQQMQANEWEMIPRGIPLGTVILIQPARHNSDLDNLAKAMLDAAQGVVFEDDRWVDVIIAARHDGKEEIGRLTVFRLSGE